MSRMSTMLKALSDPTRFKIMELLLENNYCVGAVAKRLNITESAVSQHLKILRDAGMIVGKKIGYFVHYEVDASSLLSLAASIEELADRNERKSCDMMTDECKCKRVFERFSTTVPIEIGGYTVNA